MNIMFACDLDNTLIYGAALSQKLNDYVVVEKLADKPITYASKRVLALLKELKTQIEFVPVTARSIEEFRRLKIFDSPPNYAITSMGGVILKNNIRDPAWDQQTANIIAPLKNTLEEFLQKFAPLASRARLVDNSYLFIKSNIAETIVSNIKNLDNKKLFDIYWRKEKIYVVPKGIDKGVAVQEVHKQLGAGILLAAGDSDADLPMLTIADYAWRLA